MKLPTDVVKMYKEIHGWVGIVSGLALFIAFYAGAITMFEEPLQRWASPPTELSSAPKVEDTPTLVTKVLAAYPEAAKGYDVNLQLDSARPARVSWSTRPEGADEHAEPITYYASLAADGSLQVESKGPSPVAQFVDILHQQVGLPLDHEIAMPIMGVIALLYMIAIVSGLIVLLPSLVSDLFALRVGKNVKRMWLDVHNVLGLFSLPFHIIMALTAIVFAFHDQFYDAQGAAFGEGKPDRPAVVEKVDRPALAPIQVIERLQQQVSGFEPIVLSFGKGRDGSPSLRVTGYDPRYGLRGPTFGVTSLDPITGDVMESDYLPGRQDGWSATLTSFFSLHFGSFGGAPVRWAYFLMGLAGAFLFYTGNLLWVESRRKRERKAGAVTQTKATKILGALTVGVPLGCISGISVTVASAKLLGFDATEAAHSIIYYAIFLGMTAWALLRGAAKAGMELPIATGVAMLAIPAASALAGGKWYDTGDLILVDIVAALVALTLFVAARSSRRRALAGGRDSVWSVRAAEQVAST